MVRTAVRATPASASTISRSVWAERPSVPVEALGSTAGYKPPLVPEVPARPACPADPCAVDDPSARWAPEPREPVAPAVDWPAGVVELRLAAPDPDEQPPPFKREAPRIACDP